jgi:hypothetical protein
VGLGIAGKYIWDHQHWEDVFVQEWTEQAYASFESKEAANPGTNVSPTNHWSEEFDTILHNTMANFGVTRLPKGFKTMMIDRKGELVYGPPAPSFEDSVSIAPVDYGSSGFLYGPWGQGYADQGVDDGERLVPASPLEPSPGTGNKPDKGKVKAPKKTPKHVSRQMTEEEWRQMNEEDFSYFKWQDTSPQSSPPRGALRYSDDSDHDELYANPSPGNQFQAPAAVRSSPLITVQSPGGHGTGNQSRNRATSKVSSKVCDESLMMVMDSASPPICRQGSNSPAQRESPGPPRTPVSAYIEDMLEKKLGRTTNRLIRWTNIN